MLDAKISTAILGASGYTGAELLKILVRHPNVEIAALTGDSQAGKPVSAVFPHLAHFNFPTLSRIEDVDFSNIRLVFCCLPHGATQEVVASLPEHVVIIDL